MKNSPNNYLLAVVALIFANIIGGGGGFASKILLRELPPFTILFFRLTVMSTILLILTKDQIQHIFSHRKQLGLLGLFLAGNLSFFIFGIQFTTVIASSIIYLGVPILVLIEDWIINKKRLQVWQIVGIFFGLMGSVVILLESIGIKSGFGSLFGNILLIIAITSYSFYLTYSKRMSVHVSPLGLTTATAIVSWGVSFGLMILFEGTRGLSRVPLLSVSAWEALFFVSILLGVVMYFLNQWGIKHASAVIAGAMLYVGTLTAWASGVLFLSEKITFLTLLGGALLIVGVFFTTLMPFFISRRISPTHV